MFYLFLIGFECYKIWWEVMSLREDWRKSARSGTSRRRSRVWISLWRNMVIKFL